MPNPLNIIAFIRKYPALCDLENELLLDLQNSILSQPDAYDHVKKCDYYLHLQNQNLSSFLCNRIAIDELGSLFTEATRKRVNGEKYITGLQIFMGTDGSGSQMMLVYQPVYLKWLHYDIKSQKDIYDIPDYGYGNYYVYKSNQFSAISESMKNTIIQNYRTDMSLIHATGGTHYELFDPVYDVTSCLIPFQLMYKLLDETPSKELFVTNGIREVETDSVSPVKHIVIISGEPIEEMHAVPAKYADRSHLCPPGTTVFDFNPA